MLYVHVVCEGGMCEFVLLFFNQKGKFQFHSMPCKFYYKTWATTV